MKAVKLKAVKLKQPEEKKPNDLIWLSLDDDKNIYVSSIFRDNPVALVSLQDIVNAGFQTDMPLSLMKKWKSRFEKLIKIMEKYIAKEQKNKRTNDEYDSLYLSDRDCG